MQAPQFINQFFFGNSVTSSTDGAILQTHHLYREGRVEEDIIPGAGGRIYIDGVSWPAQSVSALFLAKGTRVRVTSYRNMVLFVEPVSG